MSHRKFEAPRHGSLGFLPRKRAKRPGNRSRIKSFPKDNRSAHPHLTAFLGYKAGTTHVVKEMNKPGSKLNKKDVVEAVTVIEAPPMVVVGIVGYYETPFGLRSLATVWAHHVSNEVKRRMVKNWGESKKNAFIGNQALFFDKEKKRRRKQKLQLIAKKAKYVRVLAHTQIGKMQFGSKKAHLAEIQINGGSAAAKLKFGYSLLEKFVSVSQVFKKDEVCDIVGITKGKGFKGVTYRYGIRKLPRKTHKGLRKVGCIGAWHPPRVSWTVGRAGQKGFHNRVLINKKIYLVGKSNATEEGKNSAMTAFDMTEKDINPVGGFPNYGTVTEDFLLIKGSVLAPPKRVVALRKGIHPNATKSRAAKEEILLKFIDTASKHGTGHFQTIKEKKRFMGATKKDRDIKRRQDLEKARAAQQTQ